MAQQDQSDDQANFDEALRKQQDENIDDMEQNREDMM